MKIRKVTRENYNTFTKGKLMFINWRDDEPPFINSKHYDFKPIVVSETEPIEPSDKILYQSKVYTVSVNRGLYLTVEELSIMDLRTDLCEKVIAFHDQIPSVDLELMERKVLNHGDEVLLECEKRDDFVDMVDAIDGAAYQIRMYPDGDKPDSKECVILHKVIVPEKSYSRKEVALLTRQAYGAYSGIGYEEIKESEIDKDWEEWFNENVK